MKTDALIRRVSVILPLIAAAAGLVLLATDPPVLRSLRLNLFDQYQRLAPRAYTPQPVRIVDIDEESLAKLGQWPWPRTAIAQLVANLAENGAAAIGFDVMFSEPDRTSPAAMADIWPLTPPLRRQLTALPDHDQVFASIIAQTPVVIGYTLERATAVKTGNVAASTAPVRLPAMPYRYIKLGGNPVDFLHNFATSIPSLPVLESAAPGVGALSFVPDSDGVVRRVPLALRIGDQAVSTLATETLRISQGQRNIMLKQAEGATGLSEIRVGGYTVPTTAQGELWVHYSEAVPGRYIPAWKVLAGEVPAEQIDGHLILIGASAQGLMDLRFSPLGRIMPGVEAHAQALEQILSGHFLERPTWAMALEGTVLVLGTLIVGFLALRTRALTAAVAGAIFLVLVVGGGWYAFEHALLLLNTVTPALVMALTFIIASLVHHYISEREQRWIKDAFSRYVSPNRVDFLVNNPDAMALGGQRRECSFIFTDLAGFTTLMESIDPAEAVSLLNAYLDEMIGIAFRHEGTLDRIVGDAVAIMFSAPVPQADHRARAYACAMEMDAFASRYAANLQAKGIRFGKTRIGIHSGEVIVGNFGGSTIFDYRALGDSVNTAARLESVNKHLGTVVCLSEVTLAGCPEGTPVRPVGRLVLKGKSKALKVFEPLTSERQATYAPLDRYQAAYDQMASDDTASALAEFRALAEAYPDDPLPKLHYERLAAGQHGEVIVMSEK